MKVGVLALQGAFIEHEKKLEKLGVECIELRQKKDLEQDFDGLILPGGESTVQGKLLKELDMFDNLQKRIQNGLPTLATCAGLILLAKEIENQNQTYFSTIPMMVKRNAYGRQLGSFHTTEEIKGIGKVKAIQLKAVTEIAIRMFKTSNYKAITIKQPHDLAKILKSELKF